MASVDPDLFRQVAGRFATGVTVVTTHASGVDHAMTANAFTSVSLDPVLVLVSVDQEARFHDAVISTGHWTVNVLGRQGREASNWFATQGRPLHGQLDRFPFSRSELTGAAVLDVAMAVIDARTVSVTPAGDHSLVIGEVLGAHVLRVDDEPLIYYRRRYRALDELH